ncbi:PREDICTED: kelch-like protein 18 [Branchiostoma belcheri]|uniref:Kelch-like protein 18 n=1 Tax=Branchiostoma belcheri TaxID=7741 RepID=A0A6P4Y1F8_BRABE|nr:PREDICTED: kelch-like protein 18 [Branchiostoma belcheri]
MAAARRRHLNSELDSNFGTPEQEEEDDEERYYTNENHGSSLTKGLMQLYKNGQLCDVTLDVQGQRFPCHRNVLAASVPYFYAMFTSGLRETNQGDVPLHGVTAPAIAHILEYVYSGKVCLSTANTLDILSAANLFQMPELCHACCLYISQHLTTESCLDVFILAKLYEYTDLRDSALIFIGEYFLDISSSDSFLSLPTKAVVDILSSNGLWVLQEEQVLEAALRWLKHLKEREDVAFEVLKNIRYPLLQPEFLANLVQSEEIFYSSTELERIVKTILRSRENHADAIPMVCYHGDDDVMPNATPREGMQDREMIVFVGSDHVPHNCFEPEDRRAYAISPPPAAETSHPACVSTSDGVIFWGGGVSGYTDVRSEMFRYNPDTNRWDSCAHMQTPRQCFSLSEVGGKLYASGGLGPYSPELRACKVLNTVECYDIARDSWTFVASMPKTVSDHSSVSLAGVVCVLGGEIPGAGSTNAVMAYSPDNDAWREWPPMYERRQLPCSTVINNRIYVAGGYLHLYKGLSSIEVFNPDVQQWHIIRGEENPIAQHIDGILTVNDHIYLCADRRVTGRREFTNIYLYSYNVFDKVLVVEKGELERDIQRSSSIAVNAMLNPLKLKLFARNQTQL